MVKVDLNAHERKRTNPIETATGKCGLGKKNVRGDTLEEWATAIKYKIMNTMFQMVQGVEMSK